MQYIQQVIFRYFQSMENDTPFSHIHGREHSLNLWWDIL